MLFRKLQRKWKHNHSEACSEAVEGKWDPSHDPGMDLAAQEEPLDMEGLKAFWRPLFKKQSLPDSRAPEATRDPNWNVVNPISTPEVKWAIKNSKRRTAPGLDCQKLSDIASIPQGELISLFNLWMHAGCCPSGKTSRAILSSFDQAECIQDGRRDSRKLVPTPSNSIEGQ